jgi:hypothetical protein
MAVGRGFLMSGKPILKQGRTEKTAEHEQPGDRKPPPTSTHTRPPDCRTTLITLPGVRSSCLHCPLPAKLERDRILQIA